jgi:hypothetical protein
MAEEEGHVKTERRILNTDLYLLMGRMQGGYECRRCVALLTELFSGVLL